jgi:hypothetical protein
MKREFLITKFVCAKCGTNLQLSYDKPKSAGSYIDGEPTGAAMVQNLIAIEPCDVSMEPLEAMKKAFKKAMA